MFDYIDTLVVICIPYFHCFVFEPFFGMASSVSASRCDHLDVHVIVSLVASDVPATCDDEIEDLYESH